MRSWQLTALAITMGFSSLASASTAVTPEPRIIGGGYEPIGNVPWQVFIQSNSGLGDYVCGGVVISEQYVLTAAHCMDKDLVDGDGNVVPYLPSEVTVYSGVEDLSNLAGNEISVSEITIHPNYNDFSLVFDIAVIRLAGNLPSSAQPVVILPPSDETQLESEFSLATPNNLFVGGWGRFSNSSNSISRYYKSTVLTGEPDSQCSIINLTDSSDYLCATSNEVTGSCNGDSGGGLIWRDPSHASDSDMGYRVVGVVSWGSNTCGIPGDEDVFAQVTSYYSWIDTQVGGYTPPNSTFTVDIFDTSDSYDPTPTSPAPSGGGGSFAWLSLLSLGLLTFRRRLS
ncbi:Trypsin [Grimontia celer]|uniref:Trypsin n=1 Tax=Grimontia celer TaxID=1796497 RepID=A0A128ERF9_9GAMM|nr:serine protease [Grimontia celer]CZF77238.1 Trypsin [Grimontia celer]